MDNAKKYSEGYFLPPQQCTDWTKKDRIQHAPIWCSVDLRDGNQALVNPMTLEQKLEFFTFLTKLGFKQIEIGFPAASDTEYAFARRLIEDGLIPDDVTVQVLTQAREHIIKRTFEALKGVKSAIVHFYNSVSVAQREQVFKKSREDVKRIAAEGAMQVSDLAQGSNSFLFEYSPESFSGTEPEYALEVCDTVSEIIAPTPERPLIINLPTTVQLSMPHVFASQVEFMSKNLKRRDSIILSVHPHNDRGCGISDAELAVLAGAQRVEGTLFGNGERTGNADIVTLALNLYSHGVTPGLDFSDLPAVVRAYKKFTGMTVHERHPYAGDLVFTAFSGSHQDAIAKGMKWRQQSRDNGIWSVPYLPIDPKDIGRDYDGDIIRINSQSGKGGIGYILEHNYGFDLPPKMREQFGYAVKSVSDKLEREVSYEEIYQVFQSEYLNVSSPLNYVRASFTHNGEVCAGLTFLHGGREITLQSCGNGGLDAVASALRKHLGVSFPDLTYKEHALTTESDSPAAAYVGFGTSDGGYVYGAGTDRDIMAASVKALFSAVNNMLKAQGKQA